MPACVRCGELEDVRLFDVRHGEDVDRQWWCLRCAWIERGLGQDIQNSPAWIERAALRRLPTRELVDASDPLVGSPSATGDRPTASTRTS